MKKNLLLFLKNATAAGREKAVAALRKKKNVAVLAVYGDTAIEVSVTDKDAAALQDAAPYSAVYEGPVPAADMKEMSDEGKQIAKVWNQSRKKTKAENAAGDEAGNRGLSWGTKGFDEPRPHNDISGDFFLKTLREKGTDEAAPALKPKPFSQTRSKKAIAGIEEQLMKKLKDPTRAYHLSRLAVVHPELEEAILNISAKDADALFTASRTERVNLGLEADGAQDAAPEAACWRMDGEISVGVVFVESSQASGPKFTATERTTLQSEIQAGLNFLAAQHPVGNLTWVYNYQFITIATADGTNSSKEDYWRNPAMGKVNYNGNTYTQNWAGVVKYRSDMRNANNSAHAIVVFVTPYGTDWHAYADSARLTLARRGNWGGWGINTIDTITAHEVCHLFGAADEYTGNGTPCSSCTTKHGCLSMPNGNCKACATNPVPCLMDQNSLAICGYTRGQIGWPAVWDWQNIDSGTGNKAIAAAGNSIYKLKNNGEIWAYNGTPNSWLKIDQNPATIAIVAAGNNLYQLHNTGKIWKYTGTPISGWQLLDTNPATKAIAAAGNNLYQMHNNGKIWKYTGVPVSGWQLIDTNPATVAIVASGNDIFQLHNTGKVWKYTGVPVSGWQMLSNNAATKAIAAAGGSLYQLQNTGKILKYTGVPLSGWQIIDTNPATVAIAAGGAHLVQLHNTKNMWQYLGTPITGWQQIDFNPATIAMAVTETSLYQLHSTGKIWKFTGALV